MTSSQQMQRGPKDQASQVARIFAFAGGVAKPKRLLSAVALAMAISLLSLLAALPAGALGGSSFNALDGALDAGAAGLIVQKDTPSGTGDNSFAEGVKEDTAVPSIGTGSVPGKADLLKFTLATENAGGQVFLYLSWERQPERGGTTDMDFEINQSETLSANGVTPIRTVGDLLITYALSNGGDQVEMAYRLWEGTNWGSPRSLAGFAEGSFNTDPATGDHSFGEAVINLTASGLFPAGNCVNFGSAFVKSRSSQSFESKMKDFIAPVPVLISNCGKIVITKDTVPNGETDFGFTTTGTGLSAFSLDDDANGTLPSSKVFANLQPGSYAVTEAAAAGFELTSLTCRAGTGASGTRNGTTADIIVVAGSQVDCTFVNTAQPAHLNVIKRVVNNNGGSATAGDFAISVTGTDVSKANFNGQEAPGTSVELKAGSYGVTEEATSGYAASYSADCQGTIERGATKTCLITNDDQPPGLTVVKRVINDNGGTKSAADFTMNVKGTLPDPPTFPGDEDGTKVDLKVGAFEVTEGASAGYTVSYSEDCTGSIGVGQTKVCTVTNDDIQPKLIVKKVVVNDNGGTRAAGDFDLSVTGIGADPSAFDGSEDGVKVKLDIGAYSVSEAPVAGYAGSLSADCTGTIALGQTKTCTITNDDVQPTLTVIKNVVNDNGGTLLPADFNLVVKVDDGATAPVPASFSGSAGTEVALDAGSYKVTEDAVAGYAGTFSEGCSGVLAPGDKKTCTVTNIDLPPGLTVVKRVINDNGGTKTAGDFEISVKSAGTTPAPFSGSETGTELVIDTGAYEVTERTLAGYRGTFSDGCKGTIALGEARLCTITNDDVQPRITVVKKVINDSGGTRAASSFTLFARNGTAVEFPGSEGGTEVGINAGAYTIDEVNSGAYVKTRSAGCEGTISVGQTRTCTVTNNDSPAVEVLGVTLENGSPAPKTETKTVEVLGLQLPQTGINIGLGLMAALTLMVGGYGFLWLGRRKEANG